MTPWRAAQCAVILEAAVLAGLEHNIRETGGDWWAGVRLSVAQEVDGVPAGSISR